MHSISGLETTTHLAILPGLSLHEVAYPRMGDENNPAEEDLLTVLRLMPEREARAEEERETMAKEAQKGGIRKVVQKTKDSQRLFDSRNATAYFREYWSEMVIPEVAELDVLKSFAHLASPTVDARV